VRHPASKVHSLISLKFPGSSKGTPVKGKSRVKYDRLSSASTHGFLNNEDGDAASSDGGDSEVEIKLDNNSEFTIEGDSDDSDDDDIERNVRGIEMTTSNASHSDIKKGRGGAAEVNEAAESVVILRNISLKFPSGSLIAVCGSTGSGKSTLISGLLGECDILGGSVAMHGKVSLVSQSAWIQNATVRANILFGLEYDEAKYRAVIAACALEVDLKHLPDGDSTDIGEKGKASIYCSST
jgi:ABC-type multidrug transport system fused ATPase/permease subunit